MYHTLPQLLLILPPPRAPSPSSACARARLGRGQLTSLVQHNGVFPLVEKDKGLALVRHERAKVIAHHAVPREPILAVEKLLDVLGHVAQLAVPHLLNRLLRRLARIRPHVLRVRAVLVHIADHLGPVPRRERAPRRARAQGPGDLLLLVHPLAPPNEQRHAHRRVGPDLPGAIARGGLRALRGRLPRISSVPRCQSLCVHVQTHNP